MSPALWGDRGHLATLFPAGQEIHATEREFVFRYRSAAHWLEVFRTYYGPVHKAFEAVGGGGRDALQADLMQLLGAVNMASDGTFVAPSPYLEAVIRKPA
jgi:hypothetical protein